MSRSVVRDRNARRATAPTEGHARMKKSEARGRKPLSRAHVERLMHYYHLLQELRIMEKGDTVSSSQVADLLDLDDTLVRKDLAAIGVRGCPRVGYVTADVVNAIQQALGLGEPRRAVVVGAGRLGGAIAAYPGFAKYGLTIAAVVDANPEKVGTMLGEHRVRALDELGDALHEHEAEMVILTLPAEVAQDAVDRAVAAGVRAIWNFAPTQISAPEGVRVRHEHLSTGFAELAYHLKRR